jgi:hypothetical protein
MDIFFGNKDLFEIEISPAQKADKYYIRLWFCGQSIGYFKQKGSLDYLIKDFFKIARKLDTLYEDKFSFMQDREIFDDIVMMDAKEVSWEEENVLVERMESFALFFGDLQFTNFTFIVINLKEEQKVKLFVYEMIDSGPKFYVFKIGTDFFLKTYKEFMLYAYDNNLKKSKPFFPKEFSLEDIKE